MEGFIGLELLREVDYHTAYTHGFFRNEIVPLFQSENMYVYIDYLTDEQPVSFHTFSELDKGVFGDYTLKEENLAKPKLWRKIQDVSLVQHLKNRFKTSELEYIATQNAKTELWKLYLKNTVLD